MSAAAAKYNDTRSRIQERHVTELQAVHLKQQSAMFFQHLELLLHLFKTPAQNIRIGEHEERRLARAGQVWWSYNLQPLPSVMPCTENYQNTPCDQKHALHAVHQLQSAANATLVLQCKQIQRLAIHYHEVT
jgi:hypothetical protein